MMKRITYSVLIALSAISCQYKTADHSQHNMPGMEGMNVPEMHHDTSTIENYLYDVVNPVSEVVLSNQGTVKPFMRELEGPVSADGYIAFDERRSNKVSAKYGGRIEKLYVKYNYQYVKKGEKIMELYSPEVNTIQEEYIHHIRTYSDKNLVQKTKEKLLLLGLSENQISEMENKMTPFEVITIYTSYDGYISFELDENKDMQPNSPMQTGMNMGMVGSQNKSERQFPASSLKEGSYINKGQTLFIVNDFKDVWAIVAFSPKDESLIKINAPVTITSELADEQIDGSINFIEPIYQKEQKFTQARIYLKNDKLRFKINSLVTVQISMGEKKLCLPSGAVLDLGERKIVWVKTGNNKFQARVVSTGMEMNGLTEIISGITANDETAKDAGFMIDSESLITSK